MMKPLELAPLSQAHLDELDTFYRTTQDGRRRPRAQRRLLAAAQKRRAPRMAALGREPEPTVRHWLTRYAAAGIAGLTSQPHPGSPAKGPPASTARLLEGVRRRPRPVGPP